MTIGIISAMIEEISLLLQHIKSPVREIIGKREYFRGQLFDNNVVIVFSRWGKVASSSTATTLIDKFGVDEIIFTGVSGSIVRDLSIGDIVVGKKLYQYDMDARPLFNKYEVPLLEKVYFETDTTISSLLYEASKIYIDGAEIDTVPKLTFGNIGTGDRFVNDTTLSREITRIDNIKVVEMEGAAVAQVCYEHDIPFGVVRFVSDNSNSDAHVDFQDFIQSTACVYSLGIIKNYLNSK